MLDDFSSYGFAVIPIKTRVQNGDDRIFSSDKRKANIKNNHVDAVSFEQERFRLGKFLGDILTSAIGCLILVSFFSVLAFLLFLNTGKNPFFLQTRVGKNGKHFRIIKFKTMNDKRDGKGNLLPDEQRVTRIGEFLRKTSMDELPQLLNVLKGDMSLIGPRPWVPEQMEEEFTLHERACRCRVKPGITGLAQVYGRNNLTFRERLPYDLWYIRHQSFTIDMMILWKTAVKVLKRDGILQRKDALSPKTTFSSQPERVQPY